MSPDKNYSIFDLTMEGWQFCYCVQCQLPVPVCCLSTKLYQIAQFKRFLDERITCTKDVILTKPWMFVFGMFLLDFQELMILADGYFSPPPSKDSGFAYWYVTPTCRNDVELLYFIFPQCFCQTFSSGLIHFLLLTVLFQR